MNWGGRDTCKTMTTNNYFGEGVKANQGSMCKPISIYGPQHHVSPLLTPLCSPRFGRQSGRPSVGNLRLVPDKCASTSPTSVASMAVSHHFSTNRIYAACIASSVLFCITWESISSFAAFNPSTRARPPTPGGRYRDATNATAPPPMRPPSEYRCVRSFVRKLSGVG